MFPYRKERAGRYKETEAEVFCKETCLKVGREGRDQLVEKERDKRKDRVDSNRDMWTIDLHPVVTSGLVIGGNLHKISQ
jgi:hypothetical protein